MKKGFTLLELIIVVIIIGILVGIALPRFMGVAEKARAAEGLSILGALRSSQIRYYAQSAGGAYTATCNDLDTPIASFTARKWFNDPSCPGSATGNIVTIQRTSGLYTLGISADGTISCSGTCTGLSF